MDDNKLYAANGGMLTIPPPHVVLSITPDGRLLRGDQELTDLPREDLITIIQELVELFRRR